ncbi:TraR/DksA C4-type zinc finger protein [Opitutus sp. GAS368]|uniref:TraR/DksA family transcriptional regulator n=1 Tax=Opitutus sp. GAS368 TaxID=1882749 RepID=UPI00087B3125|nr:TraR/DksA C4-type zinc finger protein [Opitutus sp. GAS368]SDS44900.1 dksA/traR C4-type zinc finger [Opitutus sp. GAS368]
MSKSNPARSRRDRLRVNPQWAWHYRTLTALRDHLIQEQQSPQSADRFDRDFIRALLAREPDALGEIYAALDRILHGTYGVCEATGRRIAPARLRAAPWTRYRSD